MRVILWPAEDPLASQEELCHKELLSNTYILFAFYPDSRVYNGTLKNTKYGTPTVLANVD
jgi:hypothetical protein